jgi:hypothetical protein
LQIDLKPCSRQGCDSFSDVIVAVNPISGPDSMIPIPPNPRRKSIRLPHYDYTSPGAYFVTICAYGRMCLFGNVVGEGVVLNEWGRVVERKWIWLGEQYDHVEIDEFIIMPNHVHGIIVLTDECRGGSRTDHGEQGNFYRE